jgi:hypothetical protein
MNGDSIMVSPKRNEAEQRRDVLLLRLLKMPPQPRPKRERDKSASRKKPKPKRTGARK